MGLNSVILPDTFLDMRNTYTIELSVNDRGDNIMVSTTNTSILTMEQAYQEVSTRSMYFSDTAVSFDGMKDQNYGWCKFHEDPCEQVQ